MGKAHDVKSNFKQAYFYGNTLDISDEKSVFKTAKFTSCEQNNPKKSSQYTIHSDTITYYPDSGNVISNQNQLYLFDVPLFYFPRFIYQLGNDKAQYNPFPSIGHTPVDGSYIFFNIPYVVSPHSIGKFVLGTSSLRGYHAGATHAHSFNKFQRLQIKAFHIYKTGYAGGLTYSHVLNQDDKHNTLFEFFETPSEKRQGLHTFEARFLKDEIQNNHLVNLYPELTLQSQNIAIISGIKLNNTLKAGKYTDIQTTAKKVGLHSEIYKTFFEPYWVSPTISYTMQRQFYSEDQHWDKTYASISLEWKIYHLRPTVTYTKALSISGKSPFLFDSEYTIENDELGLSLDTQFGPVIAGVDANYDLVKSEYRQLRVSTGISENCWECRIGSDLVRNTVYLNFSLKVN